VYKLVTIIGTGTLGGYLANALSDLDEIEELILIDYDKVLKKNLKNHIYSEKDVGKYKVDALYRILKKKKKSLKIKRIRTKFQEGITKFPKSDLVIDCRDFVYDRGNIIDIRAYVSTKYLILDCRKNVKYLTNYEGKYIEDVNKLELKSASINFALLLQSRTIEKFIQKNIIHKINITQSEDNAIDLIDKVENTPDIITDSHIGQNKLIGLYENIGEILDINKNKDITICCFDKKNPLYSKVLPVNYLKNENDLLKEITTIININMPMLISIGNFVVSTTTYKNKYYIELIPETGAA